MGHTLFTVSLGPDEGSLELAQVARRLALGQRRVEEGVEEGRLAQPALAAHHEVEHVRAPLGHALLPLGKVAQPDAAHGAHTQRPRQLPRPRVRVLAAELQCVLQWHLDFLYVFSL